MEFCLLLKIWAKTLIQSGAVEFDSLKTALKRAIKKIEEETDDLIGNKCADKIAKVLRKAPLNSSKTVINETKNIGLGIDLKSI